MNFEKLVDKLGPQAKQVLEQAVATASSRSHYSVELEHVIYSVSKAEELQPLIERCGGSIVELEAQVEEACSRLKTGYEGFPKVSPNLVRLLFDAWLIASGDFHQAAIAPGHIVLALLDSESVQMVLGQSIPNITKIDKNSFIDQLQKSSEASGSAAGQPTSSSGNFLKQYTQNLTEAARTGKIEGIVGRDDEVRKIIDILQRKKQNNPILTGEAGVGKTAVVEGLALKIVQDDVPQCLRGVELVSLDLGLLQAGAGVKGEFENRLKGVIKEIQQSSTPVVLFIDEAHTLIGAGNQAGAGDAANLIKPALARGELRTIAATTWAEYKKYFESDAALTRRFQVVNVDEPLPERAIEMMRHVASNYEKHHGVTILDEAIVAAVKLSHRYITGRQLPDKCVSLLDTACARVALSQSTTPQQIERLENSIKNINQEIKRLECERVNGFGHDSRITQLRSGVEQSSETLSVLKSRWQEEQVVVQQLNDLLAAPGPIGDTSWQEDIKCKRDDLHKLQQDEAYIHECVTADLIASIVSDWTGIPVGKMNKDDVANVLGLQEFMSRRVIGQSHGLAKIANAIRASRAGLADPNRPVGVFMLVGPSGVGKTETAIALAEQLYGSDSLVTVINMSEFKEEHKISMLLGAPPGYVGYGQGGVLTEAIRRKPYSVLLLDEMEKAHPGVHDIFYQVFDKGVIKDGEGRDIDFKNTVILMTSNCASAEITQLCDDPDTAPEPDALLDSINPVLRDTFKPAFLGRINLIPYLPLLEEELVSIAKLKMSSLSDRLLQSYGANLECDDSFYEWVVGQCQSGDIGARQVDLIINNKIMPELSSKILEQVSKSNTFVCVFLSLSCEGELLVEFSQTSHLDNFSKKAQTA